MAEGNIAVQFNLDALKMKQVTESDGSYAGRNIQNQDLEIYLSNNQLGVSPEQKGTDRIKGTPTSNI